MGIVKNKGLMSVCTKCVAVLLVFILLLTFSGCRKIYIFEELRPYYDEIHKDWVNGEYPGVVDVGIEAIKAGGKIGFKIAVDINENNSYAQDSAQKLREKYGDIIFLLSGGEKKYTEEELLPYHKEITAAWENGEYPGLLAFSLGPNKRGQTDDMIIDMDIDINNDKAEETAKSLKEKYGDMVQVRICYIYISQ